MDSVVSFLAYLEAHNSILVKSPKFDQNSLIFSFFARMKLARLKILSWSPLRISTIENSILRTFIFSSFLGYPPPLWGVPHFGVPPFGGYPFVVPLWGYLIWPGDDQWKGMFWGSILGSFSQKMCRKHYKNHAFWHSRNLLPRSYGCLRMLTELVREVRPGTSLPHAPGVRMTWVHK